MSTHHHYNPTNCIKPDTVLSEQGRKHWKSHGAKPHSHLFKLVPVSVENIVFPWGCTVQKFPCSPANLFLARR
ncbi:hypothetical protein MCOR25_009179 [Pyricularia grisea]|uniref:Uncharacterized protein n=1 Tax=Pyricularia grisea TaxID=148305 RepID=A0A6P8BLZ8_PYRGI|nr:uncharacterized protein PgNI_00414 [Pyricularia grisea]KAI6353097.1 hypothetical protein MCOR25_009179 [Pyricularia grisea]TLD17838.1 hypothetical protein PgNI_00414 [Pyricularia grisea]